MLLQTIRLVTLLHRRIFGVCVIVWLLQISVGEGLSLTGSGSGLGGQGRRSLTTKVERSDPQPLLVSIEGNIGAGKSTLLDELREENPDWIFINEPVGVWSSFRNDANENMLEVFYKDRKRWSYTFQNCALLTRFQNIESAITGSNTKEPEEGRRQVFVTERCLDTDYQVFTKMLRAEGSIDKLEYDLYECWFTLLKNTSTQLSAIVHVNTSPEVCAERIRKRGRDGEDGISIDYLKTLHGYQCDWVLRGDVPYIQTSTEGVKEVSSFINGQS